MFFLACLRLVALLSENRNEKLFYEFFAVLSVQKVRIAFEFIIHIIISTLKRKFIMQAIKICDMMGGCVLHICLNSHES